MNRMNDLIRRNGAIYQVCKMMKECFNADKEELDAIATTISNLPAVQPEIIRCRDCTYWDKAWTNDRFPDYHYCPMIDGFRKGNFYCGDGERRTNE